MFTSMTETNSASESRNSPSKSFVFNDSSINDGEYFVSAILAGDEVILLNSNSDGIEKITSALQNYASIVGQIYKVRTISGGRSGKLQLDSIILCSDYLEPYKSQLSKWESSLRKKRGLGWCYADRDSGTLDNGGRRDRLFGNAIDCLVIRKVMELRVWILRRGTGRKAIVIRQRRRDRNQRFDRASICNHIHSPSIILITFVVTAAVLKVSAPAPQPVDGQRLTGT